MANQGTIRITYVMKGDSSSFKALINDTNGLKTAMNGTMSQSDSLNKMMQSVNKSMSSAGSATNDFSELLNIGKGVIGKYFAGLTAGASVMNTVKDAFMRTESNIDLWGRTVQEAKGAYSMFLDTLNSGNWENFFTNLSNAITGASQLYNTLDRLGSVKQNNSAAIAIKQQELQRLRLEKQNTKDKAKLQTIDAAIKKTSSELAALQNQNVHAGMTAGRLQMATEIRSRYDANNKSGLSLGSKELQGIITKITHNGQSAIDHYGKVIADLTKKGTRASYATVNVNGVNRQGKYLGDKFSVDNLSKQEQKQYYLAKAIVDGESSFKDGMDTYTNAFLEGAQSTRQQVKANTWASSGSGSSGGKGGSNGKTTPIWAAIEMPEIPINFKLGSISSIKDELANAEKAFEEAGDSYGRSMAQQTIDALTKELKKLENEKNPFKDIKITIPNDGKLPINEDTVKDTNAVRDAARGLSSSFSSAASALGNFSDESEGAAMAAKAMSIASAIANLVAQFASIPKGAEVWSWIAGTVAGTAQLVTTIAQIKSATSFANGGIVSGPTHALVAEYPGAKSNPEVIAPLNRLKGMLGSDESNGGDVRFHISGRDLEGVLVKRTNLISRS